MITGRSWMVEKRLWFPSKSEPGLLTGLWPHQIREIPGPVYGVFLRETYTDADRI